MIDVRLTVNGKAYAGWQRVKITRGIESVSGGFELEVTDRWADSSDVWPIVEEDACTLALGTATILTGYVDKRKQSFTADDHTFSVSGRDKTGALIDCSVLLGKWEFWGTSTLDMIDKIAKQFDIQVGIGAGVKFPHAPVKYSVEPGESAWDFIDKACKHAGVLPVSDGQGGLQIMRPGSKLAFSALVEGQNILSGSVEYDATQRFRRYVVLGQHSGTDATSGPGLVKVRAQSFDTNVKRDKRVFVFRPEGDLTVSEAKDRAQWEATVRAARALSLTFKVQGWTQGEGTLWTPNELVPVKAPSLGIDGTMLLSQVVYSLDSGGSTAELTLRPPGAFTPEPFVPPENNVWKEIKGGA